jgi:uncharacterized protein YoxC
MFSNLMIAAAIVIILWIVIIGIFLVVSRRQPDVQAKIKEVEDQLDSVEKKAKR